MTKFFIGTFFLIACGVCSIPAQDALPVVTKTKAISGLKQLLPSAANRQPLLINFWATWCGPCKVEFPEFVKIDADYRAKGLTFAIVSLDNFGAMDSIVADFLKSYESTMPSYLLDLAKPREISAAIRQIAPSVRAGLPLTLLFDARGRLVYQKSGVIDAKILRSRIDKVLAVKPK